MTKRRRLSDVVNQELTEPAPAAEIEPTPAVEQPEPTPAAESETVPAKQPAEEPTPAAKQPTPTKSQSTSKSKTTPHYLTLVRKETRLKEEQFDELSKLSRKLNRQRKSTGDRITENTLIRVAIDLLLSQSDKLEGKTENELRESLSLPPDE
ncbi:hypothetical protein [Oscillatoria acuminata]|uniref:Uncharacterized protein n=1 Tax=Oscillatoria acuminata PCC 6304 TaxID=56110 RepID=K9TRK2_9CYAN|nr:hypothetical protein [Oscillatoria acuminata]AFY85472.1 hypothetical protein Oscil6304_6011 [Oscillatoria acuminata PCC 6304]